MSKKGRTLKRVLFILAVILIFTGCSGKKPAREVKLKPVPSWYLTPPASNDLVLYATGEGTSKEVAIKNALNSMASTLSVSVASQYESSATERRGTVNTTDVTVNNAVQSDVKKIRISNYTVEAYDMRTMLEHYVLIKSDKEQLFTSLKNELDRKFSMFREKEQTYKKLNILERIGLYRTEADALGEVENTLVVMDVLHPGFDAGPYTVQTNSIHQAYKDAMNAVSFSIQNDSNSQGLVSPIKAALSKRGYRFSSHQDNDHLTIDIRSDIENANAMGFILARSAIRITIATRQGVVIGGNKLNITGQSTQSYAIARENIAIQLNNEIHDKGIENVLGVKL